MASLEKGYFKTGDLANYDEQGWFYLEGRKDDVIFRDNTMYDYTINRLKLVSTISFKQVDTETSRGMH